MGPRAILRGMSARTLTPETTAEAYLELLKDRGIEVFLGNAGTDFASLVDAFARLASEAGRAPCPLVIPHEFVAVSMAHGYYVASRRPAAVMVHVNVGTGNAATAIITASRANVPILMSAGRTPITEEGLPGARDLHIHWAQESFDQAAMLREYVKWDYELRTPVQVEAVVDRAFELMQAEPRGPVYLTLPREVLAARPAPMTITSPARRQSRSERFPDPARIDEAARLLARADSPLILVSAAGIDPRAVAGLVELAEAGGIAISDAQLSVRRSDRRDARRRLAAARGSGAPSCRPRRHRSSAGARRRRASAASRRVGADAGAAGERLHHWICVGVPVHRRDRRRQHGGSERVSVGPALRGPHTTRELRRVPALERARLRSRRRARCEAGSPGRHGDRDRR